jgi:hypothetical protein
MNNTALKRIASVLLVFSLTVALIGDAAASELNNRLTKIAEEELDNFILGDRFDSRLESDDEYFVDYAHNASFLTSGLFRRGVSKGQRNELCLR